MATLSRVTTWAANQTLTAAALNGEFNNIINGWNNHDAGSSIWTVNNSALFKRSGDTMLTVQQAVLGTSTTAFTTTASTYQITNLSASITPSSSSSRIAIYAVSRCHTASNANSGIYVSIFRGATDLSPASGFFYGSSGSATGSCTWPGSVNYLDSPATASATVYSIKIKNDDGATTIGYGAASVQQSILLLELR